jgi:hypothetical protein
MISAGPLLYSIHNPIGNMTRSSSCPSTDMKSGIRSMGDSALATRNPASSLHRSGSRGCPATYFNMSSSFLTLAMMSFSRVCTITAPSGDHVCIHLFIVLAVKFELYPFENNVLTSSNCYWVYGSLENFYRHICCIYGIG